MLSTTSRVALLDGLFELGSFRDLESRQIGDMTLVADTFLVIKTGLAYLMDKDRIRRQAILKKVRRLGKIAWKKGIGSLFACLLIANYRPYC